MGPPILSAAVEGSVDEAVVRLLIEHVGGRPGTVYGRRGKAYLHQRIHGFNQAARHAPWVVLVDLDASANCAVELRQEWLPSPSPGLCFRVVVRAVEAWLMADADNLARYLGIARSRIARDPESVERPKQTLVNLARRSPRRNIRQDMVPRPTSGRLEGPAYSSRVTEFATSRWRPEVAAQHSDSLYRAIRCIRQLVKVSQD